MEFKGFGIFAGMAFLSLLGGFGYSIGEKMSAENITLAIYVGGAVFVVAVISVAAIFCSMLFKHVRERDERLYGGPRPHGYQVRLPANGYMAAPPQMMQDQGSFVIGGVNQPQGEWNQ